MAFKEKVDKVEGPANSCAQITQCIQVYIEADFNDL